MAMVLNSVDIFQFSFYVTYGNSRLRPSLLKYSFALSTRMNVSTVPQLYLWLSVSVSLYSLFVNASIFTSLLIYSCPSVLLWMISTIPESVFITILNPLCSGMNVFVTQNSNAEALNPGVAVIEDGASKEIITVK